MVDNMFGDLISGACDIVESVYDNTVGHITSDTIVGDLIEGTGSAGRHLLELGGDVIDVPINAGLDVVDNVVGDGDCGFLKGSGKHIKNDFNNIGDDVEDFCNKADDIFL